MNWFFKTQTLSMKKIIEQIILIIIAWLIGCLIYMFFHSFSIIENELETLNDKFDNWITITIE